MKQLFLSRSVLILYSLLGLVSQIIIFLFNDTYPSASKFLLQLSFISILGFLFYYFSKLTNSYFSLYSLFLILFVYFLGSRIILDFLGYMPIEELTMYKLYTLSTYTTCRVILNLNIALISFLLGVILFSYRKKIDDYSIQPIESKYTSNNLIDILFFIGIIFKIYFAYITFTQLKEKGYLAYFLGEFEIDKNIIEWFLESFAIVALFIYYTGRRKITKWIWFGTILYAILALSTGQRGFGFLFLVFTVLYLVQIKKIHINKKSIIILFACLYFTSVLMEYFRVSVTNDVNSISYFVTGIPSFFWNGGVSVSLIAYTIDYDSFMHFSFSNMFSNVTVLTNYYIQKFQGGSLDSNALMDNALVYKNFGAYLSYIVNPQFYKLGFALGSSYIAQLYAIGGEFLQFLGGIFVGYFISLLYYLLKSNRFFLRFVAFNFLISLIYIPRDNLFDFLTENWYAYISCIIYILLINFLHQYGLLKEKNVSVV